MRTGSQQPTAKIYQFPTGGRAAASPPRSDARAGESRTPNFCDAAFGSGWYHEAAIQETERPRKP